MPEHAAVLVEKGIITQEEADAFTDKDDYALEPQVLLQIWLDMLMAVDSQIVLNIDTYDVQMPTMHFYGFDEKKRHLDTPGYGLFLG